MKPVPESFDEPASFVATQHSAVLCLLEHTILFVRRDHFYTVIFQFRHRDDRYRKLYRQSVLSGFISIM